MVWQEVTPLLRGNIAVNSLGVPDLKSILERIVVRACANNTVIEVEMKENEDSLDRWS